MAVAQEINPNVPNPARMYDYWLGGKDHFPADREAADRASLLNPHAKACALANRAFLRRVVRYLAERGVRQFLDIGTGLPSQGNVHEIAQAIQAIHADARTVYVDYDPIVAQHGRALLATDERTMMVQLDVRYPEFILHKVLDFDLPVGVLLVTTMHFIGDEEDPWSIVRTLLEHMEPGSYLGLTHVLEAPNTIAAAAVYDTASASVTLRSEEAIREFFTVADVELVDPGLVRVPLWRPEMDPRLAEEDAAKVDVLGGVGRKER
ncbi:SAM-dependent methyltransferase [Nonomuraea basaltis]|nr:SAM-dependent methyltransferase [Nonomuraea basaltis]